LAAIKLTDKSGYPDNGYPDLQTLWTTVNSRQSSHGSISCFHFSVGRLVKLSR